MKTENLFLQKISFLKFPSAAFNDVVAQNISVLANLIMDGPDNVVTHVDQICKMDDLQLTEDQGIYSLNTNKISAFAVWLLSDFDPVGLLEIVGPICNHRRVTESNFKDRLANPMDERPNKVLKQAGGRREQSVLQQSRFDLMVFEISHTNIPSSLKYQSIGTLNIKKEYSTSSLANDVKIFKRVPKKPSMNTVAALLAFFGIHLNPSKQFPLKFTDGIFDYGKIFRKIPAKIGHDVFSLNLFLKEIHVPWMYKVGCPPALANLHFCWYFKFCTTLRVGFVDGAHRGFMINRMYQGLDIVEASLPFDHFVLDWKNMEFEETLFSDQSTMCKHLDVNFLILESYDTRSVSELAIYSRQVQEMKQTMFFRQTFGSLLQVFVTDVSNKYGEDNSNDLKKKIFSNQSKSSGTSTGQNHWPDLRKLSKQASLLKKAIQGVD